MGKKYRLFYSIISIVGLLPIGWFMLFTPPRPLMESTLINRFPGLLMATYGLFYLRFAFRQYSLPSFLGLRPEASDRLIREGVLNQVRHPLYSATILLMVGYFVYSPNLSSLVTMLCILAYLPIGIWLEERKLIATFGEEYRRYQREVPMLIPNFRCKS